MIIPLLKKVKRTMRRAYAQLRRPWIWLLKKRYLQQYPTAAPGSVAWLVGTEDKYGGLIVGVPRNVISPKDPRTTEQRAKRGMIGGGRMLHNRYANKYAEYLQRHVHQTKPVTLIEVGILKGTGLAVWSDLFKDGRIIGLDIDLGHFRDNIDNLKQRGAFPTRDPELYEFDQLVDNGQMMTAVLKGDKIDVVVDDALHTDEAILNTMKCLMPHLAEDFTYFVEDNRDVHGKIRALYPDLFVDHAGYLSVVTRRRH